MNVRRVRTAGLTAAVLVAAVALPFQIRCCTINPSFYQQIVDLTMIWSLVTISLALLAGMAGQISIGQGGFMAVGAYTSALLTTEAGWPTWSAVFAACGASAVIGVIVGLPALRLRGPYLVMATLAFAGIVYGVALNWIPVTGGPQGLRAIPPPAPLGTPLLTEFDFYFVLLVALAICIAVVLVVGRSQRGLRMKALRDDEIAAASVGVRPAYEKTAAFGLSAAIAGLAGALLSGFIGFISPDYFSIDESILALAMALVGGIHSVLGAILGALGILVLTEVLRGFSEYQLIAYGVAILLVITLVPEGITGAAARLVTYIRGRRSMSAAENEAAATGDGG